VTVKPGIINKPATPNRAKPTTNIPVTDPPKTASFIASPIPFLAASAVRTLVRTEMFIPMIPATAEKAAPITKARTVHQSIKKPKIKNKGAAI